MLLDLLHGALTMHGASSSLTSLPEDLSFTEILSSCLPDAASSLSLLHIFQEGARKPTNAFLHTHPTSAENQISLPFNYSSLLHNTIPQHHEEIKQQHGISMRPTDVAFLRGYAPLSVHGYNKESSAAQLQSPCKRSNEEIKQQHVISMRPTDVSFLQGYTPPCVHGYNNESSAAQLQSHFKISNEDRQPSTSSATSEPSSTLESMEAGEIAARNQQVHQLNSSSRWHISHAVGFRSEDGAQHSTPTSLDEGSSIQISMQESMPSAHHMSMGEGTCPTTVLHACVQIEESCSLDNYPTRVDVRNRDACGAIASDATKKRKRTRICKNIEEVESQRMTHIAVERNRRKQMNEHLSILRSLMPATYIQRGDQASIVGGAINFVKELEHVLQALQIKKQRGDCEVNKSLPNHSSALMLESLMLKQLSPHYTQWSTKCSYMDTPKDIFAHLTCQGVDVEVKLIGSRALAKVLAQKLPHQLLKAASSLESLHLKIMHLNVTTIEESVLYAFNLEIQDDSQALTANDVAQSIQNIFKL